MIFHVGKYRNGKADLIEHILRHNSDISKLSFYCAAGAFPLAAAITFCIEEFPERKQELEQKLEVLKEFYGYKEIVE